MLRQLNFISSFVYRSSNITFWRYHKINMKGLCSDLANCSFLRCPGNIASALYDQYISDLIDLLDKHSPKVSHISTKGDAKWLSDSCLKTKIIRHHLE